LRRTLAAVACLAAALLCPRGGRAHTPITTKILFNKEVIRILQASCLGCHRPGGIAPISLVTYEEARPWAKAIKEELLERRMPPWHAVKGYGEFSNAPALTQRDVEAIVNWVEGGAPKGDAALLPPGPLVASEWPLGTPDAVLAPDAPQDVAGDADERRDLLLPTGISSQRWLSGFDLRPGRASVVHCAALFRDGARPALLGTWVPGLAPARLPEGVAHRLPARARLRLRIHYRGAGEPTQDASSIGLYFSKAAAPRELRALALAASGSSAPFAQAGEAFAVVPLAEPKLASLQASVRRPDGTGEVLVWTRAPREDWAPTYLFKRPVALPKGSRVEAIAHFRAPASSLDPIVTLFYAAR
jgi:hypothetical protein